MSFCIRFVICGFGPLLMLLASCASASSLEALGAEGDEITFAYTADRAAEAERQASLYCANLGRGVRLGQETRGADNRIIAAFECR
jgi:hypothetical protein